MKEKNKAKMHPFAGHLRPTEEVVWMSPQVQETFLEQAKKTGWVYVGFVVMIFVVALLNVPSRDANPLLVLVIVAAVLGIAAVPLLLFGAVRRMFSGPPVPERVYAVTNERLLYRNKKDVATIALEHVPTISLFLGDGTKGTFSFGAFFPMWPDVEEAVSVKRLIDEAQKARMQASVSS